MLKSKCSVNFYTDLYDELPRWSRAFFFLHFATRLHLCTIAIVSLTVKFGTGTLQNVEQDTHTRAAIMLRAPLGIVSSSARRIFAVDLPVLNYLKMCFVRVASLCTLHLRRSRFHSTADSKFTLGYICGVHTHALKKDPP